MVAPSNNNNRTSQAVSSITRFADLRATRAPRISKRESCVLRTERTPGTRPNVERFVRALQSDQEPSNVPVSPCSSVTLLLDAASCETCELASFGFACATAVVLLRSDCCAMYGTTFPWWSQQTTGKEDGHVTFGYVVSLRLYAKAYTV